MSTDDQASVSTEDPKVYFAAQEKPELIAKSIWARKLIYERYVRDTGLFNLYRKMHWAYYGREDGNNFKTTEIGRDGPEGEVHVLKVNHLRSIITSWHSILGSQRSAVQPVAMGDDYEGEMQVKRSKAALDHFASPGSPAQLEATEEDVTEKACVYGAALGLQLWNPRLGPMAVPSLDPKAPNEMGGDLQSWGLSPLDFAFDPWRKDARMPWYICRLWVSTHAMVGRWPQFEEHILTRAPEPMGDFLDFSLLPEGSSPPGRYSIDEVPLYYFCHAPTEAKGMENGKQGFLLSGDVMLEWGELAYRGRDGNRSMPVQRLAPADILRSPIGFTPAWGLLAPQEAIDSLSSIQLTNQRTFGLGSMVTPKGSDIEQTQVSEGLQLVEYTPGLDKPEMMAVPQTPAEVPMHRRDIISDMGIIVGVNGVVRGDPSAIVDKSGSALALIDAKAVQASSTFLARKVRWREEFYLSTICILQAYLTTARQFQILGQSIASLTEPFDGKGIDRIIKVKVQTVNPLSQTISGRAQIADTIAERYPGQTTVGDYIRLLESGNADFLTHHLDQKERLIDRENELLSQGIGPVPMLPRMNAMGQPIIGLDGAPILEPKPDPSKRYIRAMLTDDHRHHVRGHLTVLDNPAVREQTTPQAAAVVKAVLNHIDEHEKLLATMTLKRPGLLELTGQPPLQSALPPPVDPQNPNGPPPPNHGGGSPEAKVEQPTPASGGHQPRMPSMPTNPSTGRKAPGPAPSQPPGATQ